MGFCRGKTLSGKVRLGTWRECWRKLDRTSSFVTDERRPEATGEGGGARKSMGLWSDDSGEINAIVKILAGHEILIFCLIMYEWILMLFMLFLCEKEKGG